MELYNESKTLFIPLLGKALMSRNNLFLHDPYAEEIISKVDYDFKTLKQSKWLSMFMSVRALVIDELCNEYIIKHPNATIIHLGCGLDSRCLRVSQDYKLWYDIDYEDVIEIRRNFFNEDVLLFFILGVFLIIKNESYSLFLGLVFLIIDILFVVSIAKKIKELKNRK